MQETNAGVLRRAILEMGPARPCDLLSGSKDRRIRGDSGVDAIDVRCRLAGCGLQGACCIAVSRVGLDEMEGGSSRLGLACVRLQTGSLLLGVNLGSSI